MEKKRIIFWIILALLIAIILIWGWIGAKGFYQSGIPEDRTVCDFGLMRGEIGTQNVHLCWIWHTSKFRGNPQLYEDLKKLFENSS
jgi:hypothetical protein